MYTLFLDTHDELITVALYNEGKMLIKTQESEYSHAVYLMPMIKNLLLENDLSVKDIKDIVAVNGPGSFTGLRIGLSAAKTMAYSLNIPVYLISSLSAYLVSDNYDGNKMSVIEDSKGYYISIFDKNNNVIKDEEYIEDINEYECVYKVKNELDVIKVIEYAKTSEKVNPHLVRANYVKKIEAEK